MSDEHDGGVSDEHEGGRQRFSPTLPPPSKGDMPKTSNSHLFTPHRLRVKHSLCNHIHQAIFGLLLFSDIIRRFGIGLPYVSALTLIYLRRRLFADAEPVPPVPCAVVPNERGLAVAMVHTRVRHILSTGTHTLKHDEIFYCLFKLHHRILQIDILQHCPTLVISQLLANHRF